MLRNGNLIGAAAAAALLLSLSACAKPPSCRGISRSEKLRYALEGPLLGSLLAKDAAERHKVMCVAWGPLAANGP